jgi:hypothetical protein
MLQLQEDTRMNVGKGILFAIAITLIAAAGPSARAQENRPSRQTLAAMGLSGMVVMSDEDAMSVRGQGFPGGRSSVQVFGTSQATIVGRNGGAHSQNAYAVQGSHFAAGANGSHAGVVHKTIRRGGLNGGSTLRVTKFFAGGFSAGFAF